MQPASNTQENQTKPHHARQDPTSYVPKKGIYMCKLQRKCSLPRSFIPIVPTSYIPQHPTRSFQPNPPLFQNLPLGKLRANRLIPLRDLVYKLHIGILHHDVEVLHGMDGFQLGPVFEPDDLFSRGGRVRVSVWWICSICTYVRI